MVVGVYSLIIVMYLIFLTTTTTSIVDRQSRASGPDVIGSRARLDSKRDWQSRASGVVEAVLPAPMKVEARSRCDWLSITSGFQM